MIKLSAKVLAEFMTSDPSRQRKTLRDAKYPESDEASVRVIYYREARETIVAFHRSKSPGLLLRQADNLEGLGRLNGGRSGTRLRHNARALRAYEANFSQQSIELLENLRLNLVINGVRISVVPDLHYRFRSRVYLAKLEFSAEPPDEATLRIISQLMFEASRTRPDLSNASILVLDVARGQEMRGARAGSRIVGNIEAACANIMAIWPTI
ncbi:MAG TPA: hypothetical protein VNM87_01940 [Candidatus Udaeobacter sp.]|nr:hypothetical protein [Candidatus Udaeobacter sp.]